MEENLVSVIIPVYNVEKYLDKCVESVINQTYKNLEIILVDDGSPDACPQMCDNWVKKDKRIKVIHKQNGGQGSARNMALDVCKGDYICFVDSDDFVEPDYVQELLSACLNNNADIAICKIRNINESTYTQKDETPFSSSISVSGNNIVYDAYTNQSLYSHSPCNKLYKKFIFENLRFPEIKMCEDSAIYLQTFHAAKKIVAVPNTLYNYIIHSGSTMHRAMTLERIESILKNYDYNINFVIKNNLKSLIYPQVVACLNNCVGLYRNEKSKKIKRYIKNCYKNYRKKYKNIVSFKNAPLKLKLKMIYMKIF